MTRTLIIYAILLGLPSAAMTDDYSARRASCKPLLTALYDDCSVANYYRCADGSTYIESIGPGDAPFALLYDVDHRLIYQRDTLSGDGIAEVIDVEDPFSFDGLMFRGSDTADLLVVNSMIPGLPTQSRMQSRVVLTDEVQGYSDEDFIVAEVTETLEVGFGGNSVEVRGYYLVDPRRRLLIEESATATFAGAAIDTIPNLTSIVGSDSPYFMAQTPEETCAEQLSQLNTDPAPQMEKNHDNL